MWIAINYNFITSAINSRRRNREHRDIKSCAWRWTIEISAQSQRLVTAVILQTDIIDTVSVFFIFWSHFASIFDASYVYLLIRINNVECAAQRKRVAAIRSNFPRPIFSKLRIFDFEIREYPHGCFDCLQSRAISKRQSFQRHIIVNTANKTSAHILSDTNPRSYPSFTTNLYISFYDSKKLHSSGRVFEIYRRCDRKIEASKMKNNYIDI